MKCLVLAAGYATRLYPLTENFPKPLLPVRGKAIMDWLLDDIDSNLDIEEYVIVTNHRFASNFETWKKTARLSKPIHILDDGSTDNDNRKGAVRDIAFAIEELELRDDLLVIAGDNILDFSMKGFVDYFYKKKHSCVMRYYEKETARLQRTGVAVINDNGKIIKMEEKPEQPSSNWAIPPFYVYRREDLALVKKGLALGCGTDAPGSFIVWLCGQCDVYAYPMEGKRYDIGDLRSYQKVLDLFG